MNWAWAASLDHIWRSPNLPLYLTLAAAGFVGIIVLITLLRAEKSVANGVLALDHAARDRGRGGRDLPRLRHGKRGSVDGGASGADGYRAVAAAFLY